MASRRRFPPFVLVWAMLWALVGCTSAVDAIEYGEEHRRAFLAACTDAPQDDLLVEEVCECAYERIRDTIPFEQFAEIEASLRLDALTELPNEIESVLAECFVEEADL